MKLNYYSILNITQDATSLEIKKAYKRLANIYHPDKTNNDLKKTELFKNIVLAYETLSDLNRKKIYDQELYLNKIKIKNNNNSNSSSTKNNILKDDPIFLDVYIDWEDTINGIEKDIYFSIIKYCETCAGRGSTYGKICYNCSGTGQKAFEKKYKALIPKNTLPESQVRLKGIGHISKTNFEQGDVILDIHWKKGKWVFIDNDIYTYLYITKKDKIIKKVNFINYNGEKHLVYLPDNVKEGQLLRLKNKGWMFEDKFSDLYLEIRFKESNIFKNIFDKFL